jgi:hypothetical protein
VVFERDWNAVFGNRHGIDGLSNAGLTKTRYNAIRRDWQCDMID